MGDDSVDGGRPTKPHYIESAIHTLCLKKDRSGTNGKQKTYSSRWKGTQRNFLVRMWVEYG